MTTDNRAEHAKRGGPATRSRTHRPATDRLREQAQEVAKDLQELGSIASDAVEENLEQLQDKGSKYYEQGRDRTYKAEHTVEQFIRDRPFKSILIAVGVGMFLGRFWIRH
jgi:ElaB/YqjD/DUF883 family membrane-anchored ribosome-binding protein